LVVANKKNLDALYPDRKDHDYGMPRYLKFNDSLGQDVWIEDTHDKNEVHEL
jgi:hypothetical protein